MHRIQLPTPDGHLSVVDEGSGSNVVFVHGTPSSSFEFRHVVASLKSRHRCVAPDHLGFGASDKPADGDYSVAAHQRRFALAMEALAVEDAVFVLHDFGSAIALPWMFENPDKVSGVVLANTFLWPTRGPMRWVLAFYASALGRWIYRATNLSVGLLLPWAWGSHKALTDELHASYKAPFANANERYATSALPGELLGGALAQLEPRGRELRRWPVRAVWGMADPLVGASELERWRALLPDLKVDEVERAGHFIADEAPDVVSRAVLALV